MNLNKTHKYLLIQFLDRPNNVKKYVYIPSIWIKEIKYTNNTGKVAYPEEESSITEKRVKNDEGCDENWKLWAAKVLRGTDSFDEKLLIEYNNEEKEKSDRTTMGPSVNGSQVCADKRDANTTKGDTDQRVNVTLADRTSNKNSVTITSISHYVVKTDSKGVNKVIDVSSQGANMKLDNKNRILNNDPGANNDVAVINTGDENSSKDLGDSYHVKKNNLGDKNKFSTTDLGDNPHAANMIPSGNTQTYIDSNHVSNVDPSGTDIALNIKVIDSNRNCDISPDKYVQIEENLAAMEGHTGNHTEILTTTSNEKVSVKTLPRLSKPLKKRSLDNLSQEPKTEAVKKPKVAQENATTNSSGKIAPIRISKTVSGFTVNTTSSQHFAPSQRGYNTDVVDVLENVCNELSKLNGLAKNVLKYCKELSVSFDENATSCEKMHSYVDDLVALYGEDGNYGGQINDSDDEIDSDNDSLNESDSDYGSDKDHRAQDNRNLSRSKSSRNTFRNKTPDYNARWTLKYPSKVDGTMELIPGSGIYVHTQSLSQIYHEAKSPVMLARRLCAEIFTDDALRTCSFSGLCFKNSRNVADVKPGLNCDGTRALLDFVRQESQNHPTWEVKTDLDIKKNINVFLFTYRKKPLC